MSTAFLHWSRGKKRSPFHQDTDCVKQFSAQIRSHCLTTWPVMAISHTHFLISENPFSDFILFKLRFDPHDRHFRHEFHVVFNPQKSIFHSAFTPP